MYIPVFDAFSRVMRIYSIRSLYSLPISSISRLGFFGLLWGWHGGCCGVFEGGLARLARFGVVRNMCRGD